MSLRDKRTAHSDFETMRMASGVFDVEGFQFPNLVFDEGLHFSHEQLLELEMLLRRLFQSMAEYIAAIAQTHPDLLQRSINAGAGEGWPPKT